MRGKEGRLMCLLCQDRPGDSMALLTGMPWGRHALLSANQDAMLRRHAPAADPAEGHHALPIHTHGHAPSGMHCWECCGAMRCPSMPVSACRYLLSWDAIHCLDPPCAAVPAVQCACPCAPSNAMRTTRGHHALPRRTRHALPLPHQGHTVRPRWVGASSHLAHCISQAVTRFL